MSPQTATQNPSEEPAQLAAVEKILGTSVEAVVASDDDARRVFPLLKALESEGNYRKAPETRGFQLYCLEGLTRNRGAAKCHCVPSLVTLRLQAIEAKLGRKASELRQLSGHFERIGGHGCRQLPIGQSVRGLLVERRLKLADQCRALFKQRHFIPAQQPKPLHQRFRRAQPAPAFPFQTQRIGQRPAISVASICVPWRSNNPRAVRSALMAVKRPLRRSWVFEQPPEFQPYRRVRHAFGSRINAGKALHRLTVAEGVFQGFVSQSIPLLEKTHPQHALQSDGRTTAFALGIERLDDGQQFRPWNDSFHAREKLLAAGDLLLIGNSAWEKLSYYHG